MGIETKNLVSMNESGIAINLGNKFRHLWYMVGNTPMLEIVYKRGE
jgi:hypothetical protein